MHTRLDKYVAEHQATKIGTLYVEDAIMVDHITTIMSNYVHGVINEDQFKSNFNHLIEDTNDADRPIANAVNRLYQIAKWARLGLDFELEFEPKAEDDND